MIKKDPANQYYDLLERLIRDIDEIDEQTPWQSTEPDWWLQMMVLRRSAVERKDRKPTY